jgi:hypothetical protein
LKLEPLETQATKNIKVYIQRGHPLQHIDHFEKRCRADGVPVGYTYDITPAPRCFARLNADDGRHSMRLIYLKMVRSLYKSMVSAVEKHDKTEQTFIRSFLHLLMTHPRELS